MLLLCDRCVYVKHVPKCFDRSIKLSIYKLTQDQPLNRPSIVITGAKAMSEQFENLPPSLSRERWILQTDIAFED